MEVYNLQKSNLITNKKASLKVLRPLQTGVKIMETTKVNELRLTEVKSIINFCNENNIDYRDVIDNIADLQDDFEVDNYRFIKESEIDNIQLEELESDPYILGCFNGWFIADNTNLSYDIVRALQSAEKYSEIGEHIIDNNYTSAMQEEYSRLDGYGHHFARYDGHTMEDLLSEFGYYVFKVN